MSSAATTEPAIPMNASPTTRAGIAQNSPVEARHSNFLFIDCVRGYAVLLVIITHVQAPYQDLPWRFRQLVQSGWHGVQLFFLASCVTLLLSWNHDVQRGTLNIRSFFIRRFLRIAPAYYLAAAAFYLIHPPIRFDLAACLSTLLFVNSWSPQWCSTVENGWTVVPGGWSVSVEFMFYAMFPLIATYINTFLRAMLFLGIAIVVGIVANEFYIHSLGNNYTPESLDNFIYFWLPNQLCIFSLGTCLYYCLVDRSLPLLNQLRLLSRRSGNLLSAVLVMFIAALAYIPWSHHVGLKVPYIPAHLATSLIFAVWIFVLSETPPGVFVNRAAAALGKVSFSAYLVHFGVIRLLLLKYPQLFQLESSRFNAIAAYSITLLVVLAITFVISSITYQLIESPMMSLAKYLTRKQLRVPPVVVFKSQPEQ